MVEFSSPEEAFEKVKLALIKRRPGYYYLLSYMRVVYIDKLMNVISASTDGKTIYLYRDWYESSFEEMYSIIKHELAHVFFKHPVRQGRLVQKYGPGIRYIVNLVADGIVDIRLAEDEPNFGKFHDTSWIVKTLGLNAKEEFKKKSLEELVEEFMDKLKKAIEEGKVEVSEDIDFDNAIYLDMEQELQSGEPDLVNARDTDELEEKIEKYVKKAVISSKLVGKGQGNIEREVYNALFKPKIDWVSRIVSMVVSYAGNVFVQTWTKPSRKSGNLPGYKAYSKPKVIVLDDESGSIGRLERKRFYSEMAGILGVVNKIRVIVWDDGIRHVFDLQSESDVKAMRTRAGGGTRILPVLKHVVEKEELNPWDVMIVMTDGYWFDDIQKVNTYLAMIPAKKILVTTGEVKPGFDEVIVIENVGE